MRSTPRYLFGPWNVENTRALQRVGPPTASYAVKSFYVTSAPGSTPQRNSHQNIALHTMLLQKALDQANETITPFGDRFGGLAALEQNEIVRATGPCPRN